MKLTISPKTKILISGSSAPGLTIHGIKYLVGRIFVFNLYPLSFEEFLRYKNENLFGVYLEKKEAIKAFKVPKVYFFDCGFRNTIIDDFRSYEMRQDIGHLNENFIFTQLTYAGKEVKFWRSKAKAEVDFILDKEGLIAIESKSGGRSETKSLRSFKEKYKPDKTIIACKDILAESEGTINLPFVFISTLSD